MKSFFTTFILTVLFLASTFTASFAQINWDRYEGNPVWGPELAGEIVSLFVLFNGTTYYMWYGYGDIVQVQIGLAISTDGINWIEHSGNPVLRLGPNGSWDDWLVYFPTVIYKDSTFHMWYDGDGGSFDRIGYATSPDGISWTKYDDTTTTNPPYMVSDPVMYEGPPGSWDRSGVGTGTVHFDGINYHLWYEGGHESGTIYRIGYATSADGISWIKYDDPLTTGTLYAQSDPVLNIGGGSWDYPRVQSPNVVYDGSTYHMFYSGGDFYTWQIGYASSTDGISWKKYDENPVFEVGESEKWDDDYVGLCSVIIDTVDSLYKMWYTGGGPVLTGNIGYATLSLDTLKKYTTIHIEKFYDLSIPKGYFLSQNYPNPFNPSTTIEFSLPKSEFVDLKVYNILGKEVATLVSKKLNQGNHTYTFDGKNLASGVYYYQLVAGDYREVKKMILLK